MLLNKLYTLTSQQSEGGKVSARISFDRSHPIFEGHFPGHPVVPGVCMIQITREVMEVEVGEKLRITHGDNIKFLSIINPNEHKDVDIQITFTEESGLFKVNATLLSGEVTFFKFKGTFSK